MVDGIPVLSPTCLIPFKAKAWMDLMDRKAAGEHVDSKNIRKHKNDVFRLTELIDPAAKITAPNGVYADIQEFAQRMTLAGFPKQGRGAPGVPRGRAREE